MGLFKKKTKKNIISKPGLGFILLANKLIDHEKLNQDLKSLYNLEVMNYEKDEDTVSFKLGEYTIMYTVFNFKIPNDEVSFASQTNYINPKAIEVAKSHNAHVALYVKGGVQGLALQMMWLKVVICFFEQGTPIGLYSTPTVYTLPEINEFKEIIAHDEIPVRAFVYLGLLKEKDLVSAYTLGLDKFNKLELEIIKSSHSLEEVFDFIMNCCYYIVKEDVTLHDGETIGGDENEKNKISITKGEFVQGDCFKINY